MARRSEIEQAILARVYSVSDPTNLGDSTYLDGLREAVVAALDYGLAGIESEGDDEQAPPPILLAQARLAARSGVSLDTVLRRYFAGYTLLGDSLIEEVGEDGSLSATELKRLLRSQGAIFDRLLAAVSEEYNNEFQSHPSTSEQRRAERVRRLLRGELLDEPGIDYELGAWHLGMIAFGAGARAALRSLAVAHGRQLIAVSVEGETWAWLGGEERLPAEGIAGYVRSNWPPNPQFVLGEPGHGVEGWRHSHRQAKAALAVAQRGIEGPVSYADVALLAAALRDEVLANSLRAIFLDPLLEERDRGAALRETLAAYLATGRNASSAAASLGLSRQTVTIRLRTAEERIGRPLESCTAELEVALKLDRLDQPVTSAVASQGS